LQVFLLLRTFCGDVWRQMRAQELLPARLTRRCLLPNVNCSRCATDLLALSAEMETSQPYRTQFDSWGERIDKLATCAEWRTQHGVSAEEGLIATGYERRWGARNRIVQFAKMYMFTPSSGLVNCPLAMSDGAARLCALLLDDSVKLSSAQQALSAGACAAIADAYSHLTSRSPSSVGRRASG